jgi:hypothetical protein
LNHLAIEYWWMLVIYSDDKNCLEIFNGVFFFLRYFTCECTLMDTVEFFLFFFVFLIFFFSIWLNEAIRPPRNRNFLYRVTPQQQLSSANLKFKISVQKTGLYTRTFVVYIQTKILTLYVFFFIIFRDRSNGKMDRIAVTLHVQQRELAAAVG